MSGIKSRSKESRNWSEESSGSKIFKSNSRRLAPEFFRMNSFGHCSRTSSPWEAIDSTSWLGLIHLPRTDLFLTPLEGIV